MLLATSTWLDWLHIAFERLDDVRATRRNLNAAIKAGDSEAEHERTSSAPMLMTRPPAGMVTVDSRITRIPGRKLETLPA